MGIPSELDWAAVVAQVDAFLGHPLVAAMVAASIALAFVPLVTCVLYRLFFRFDAGRYLPDDEGEQEGW